LVFAPLWTWGAPLTDLSTSGSS